MPTVFVTGATGFVGSHTASHFLARGWRVRSLVRRPDEPGLLPNGTEIVVGALADAGAYRAALRGCDAVVHVAGVVKARTLAEYRQGNAAGSAVLARAAAVECPQAMFVHVSSQSAGGPAREGRAMTETDPPRPVSWYGISKLEGEQAVADNYPGPWCVIRPSVVYGCGDPGLLELFKAVQRPWMPLPVGGKTRVQLIAVEDLSRILVSTATRIDLADRRLFAAADTVTISELMLEIAALRNKPPRPISIPAWVVRSAGICESVRQWLTRKARPFNRDKAREMLQPAWICDPTPLMESLSIEPSDLKPWRTGMRALCECYLAGGWLRRSLWKV